MSSNRTSITTVPNNQPRRVFTGDKDLRVIFSIGVWVPVARGRTITRHFVLLPACAKFRQCGDALPMERPLEPIRGYNHHWRIAIRRYHRRFQCKHVSWIPGCLETGTGEADKGWWRVATSHIAMTTTVSYVRGGRREQQKGLF